jgi:iron-sulfur cluster repair protein YtfE (RIC family)
MALVSPDTKLCDTIIEEPSVIPVINRFGISLGVSDKSIESICMEKGIDLTFFLTTLNAYINESFYPDKCFDSFGVAEIIDYLRKTNNSYLRFQLPNIERHFGALISRSDKNNNLPLLLNLYNEVKEEIVKRINNDNKWFSEILACVKDISGSISIQIEIAPELENSIEDKLSDLINMFVIHLRGEYDANLCHAVLFAIISLEKDIKQNNRIRNRILYPISVALKNASNN